VAPLKRRKFGQLAAASLTSTVLANLSSKALAQNSNPNQEIIYEVNLPRDEANLRSSSNTQNWEDQTPPVELSTAELATGKALSKTNQPALSVDNPSFLRKKPRAFFLPDSDRITKVIVLGDKTLVISTVSSTRNGHFNHLIFAVGSATKPQFRAKKVLDLKGSDQTVESILSLPNNQLLCLLGTEGIPPFAMTTLDSRTGKILSDNLALPALPPTHRFANLCQAPNGNIFATEIDSEGIPILIWMNLQEKAIITGKVKINRLAPLTFEGSPLFNDVKDLNFSSSGQLYALATDNSGKNNALFAVDIKTGRMELVRNFAAEKFAFSI
jgi:hypothetical protein